MHAAVVDLVTRNDLVTLGYTKSKGEAIGALVEIIRRAPSPRAYLVEPHVSPSGQDGLLWELGQDILSSQLAQTGVAVIGPDTVRCLALWCTDFIDELSIWNPLLRHFIYTKGLLDEIYLPAHDTHIAQEQFKGYARAAKKHGIVVHTWQPEMSSIRVPRIRP